MSAPREFIPVSDEEAAAMLREAAKTLSSTILWIKDQDYQLNTHLALVSYPDRVFHAWQPRGFDPRAFHDTLAKTKARDCYFSVSLMRANVFFKASFLSFEKEGLRFRIPDKIFKVQRRNDLRMIIPENHTLKVEFQDPLFPESRVTKKVWDISAGGLAFIGNAEEKAYYQKDMTLKGLAFTVNQRTIKVDAIIRHTASFPENFRIRGIKIGVQFQNIRPGESQHVAAYVFEESRKYYSKFL